MNDHYYDYGSSNGKLNTEYETRNQNQNRRREMLVSVMVNMIWIVALVLL